MFLFTRCWLPGLCSLALPLVGQAQTAPTLPLRAVERRTGTVRKPSECHFGPSVGLLGSTVQMPDLGYRATSLRYRAGFEAGVAGNWARGPWALQVAARYVRLGYTRNDQVRLTLNAPPISATADYRLNYLTVPVSVAFTPFTNRQRFQIYAGFYIARFLSGRYEKSDLAPGYPNVLGPVRATDTPDFAGGRSEYVQPWDAGLQVGLGHRFGPALLQAGYVRGLRNVAPVVNGGGGNGLSQSEYYNRAFRLSLTYFAFGPRN